MHGDFEPLAGTFSCCNNIWLETGLFFYSILAHCAEQVLYFLEFYEAITYIVRQ